MWRPDSTRRSPDAFVVAFLSDSGIDEVAILFPPLRRDPSAFRRPGLLPTPARRKTGFQCAGRWPRGLKTILEFSENMEFYMSPSMGDGVLYGLGAIFSPAEEYIGVAT